MSERIIKLVLDDREYTVIYDDAGLSTKQVNRIEEIATNALIDLAEVRRWDGSAR